MNSNPIISVLIPIWNVEKYITRCLQSVFDQTIIDKTEIILLNDCTPDNSMLLVKDMINNYPHLKDQITIINHEINKGSGISRQTLLENAHGKYIIFVDADDWCELDYLEKLYNSSNNEHADIIGCDLFIELPNKTTIAKCEIPNNNISSVKKLLLGHLPAWLSTKLIKRSFLVNNLIRFDDDLSLWEDLYYCIQIFMKSRSTSYISVPLYHYNRLNPNSISLNIISKANAESAVRATNKIEKFLHSQDDKSLYDYELTRRKIRTKILCLTETEKNCRKYFYALYPDLYKEIKLKNFKDFIYKMIFFMYKIKLYFIGNILIQLKINLLH